ncbi:CYTH and CHAD domain-containing protein [Nitrosophilus labii]|uniref:CYTH and CHAD domain-containing protein n=1 Tax=Nitrosophilus labii TaxID=2706014 RepID=UPI001656FBAD|nr:CHAD domain-containing protein [Nitrosophilus labii]
MALEIEKKFLLKPFNIENFLKKAGLNYKSFDISQFYIFDSNTPIRIRKFGKKYFLTLKKGEGLAREEFEREITKDEFENILSNYKDIYSLYKTRYKVKTRKKIYEIDRFEKELKGLFFLEVEFKDEKEAKYFNIDKRFKQLILEDVTEDIRFSNFFLAKNQNIPTLQNCENILNIEEIAPLCSTKEASKTILHSLFRRAEYYREKILTGDEDIENLHQIRVSLRKMLVFLKEFKEFFQKKWFETIYSQTKEVMSSTNKKRDIDVLLSNFDEYLSHLPPSMKDYLKDFKDKLQEIQEKEQKRILELLKSEKFKNIKNLIDSISFTAKASFPIIVTSYKIIKKREKKIFFLAKSIVKNTPAYKYHELRIQFKRIRYLLEFFSRLYQKKETQIFIKNCKNIQDILGRHQDLEVQRIHIKEYLKKRDFSFDTILSVGKLIGDMEFEEFKQRKLFRKLYKKLSKRLKSSIIF